MMAFTPTPTIEIGFTGPSFSNAFVVGDTVRGALDDPNYRLDGTEVLVDLTDRCVSLSTFRGRSDPTQPFGVGSANLTFRNEDGELDPDDTWSTYWPGIVAGRTVRVTCEETVIFTGQVDDIDLSYSVSGEATFSVRAVDMLSKLAPTTIPSGTVLGSQASGARITSVLALASVDYTDTVDLDTGQSTMAAETTSSDINALAYVQQVARSEDGALFAEADGTIRFVERNGNDLTSSLTFADDGYGLPYRAIRRQIPARALFNRIDGTLRLGSVVLQSDDTASQGTYGIRAVSWGDMLNATEADAEGVFGNILVRLSEAGPRFSSAMVTLNALQQEHPDTDTLLGLELGDAVEITFSPPNANELTQVVVIESVTHSATPTGTWDITLTFAPSGGYFIIGDATGGRLDHNTLGY